MLEFVAGLVLGAILGVAADRVWTRFEKIPRFRIKGGFFVALRDERGMTLKVQNAGTTEIPPTKLSSFTPNGER